MHTCIYGGGSITMSQLAGGDRIEREEKAMGVGGGQVSATHEINLFWWGGVNVTCGWRVHKSQF